MKNQDASDQIRPQAVGASTAQGTAQNKVKNKLPNVQPYEDISASAALLGQVIAQLQNEALAFDSKPLESLLGLLSQFNVDELLAEHVSQLRNYLLDLNATLVEQTSVIPKGDNLALATSTSAGGATGSSAKIESSLLNTQESAVRQLATQSVMRDSLSSVQFSTANLLNAIDVSSLDESFTQLNWSIGAVENAILGLGKDLPKRFEQGVGNAIRGLLNTVASLKVVNVKSVQQQITVNNQLALKPKGKQTQPSKDKIGLSDTLQDAAPSVSALAPKNTSKKRVKPQAKRQSTNGKGARRNKQPVPLKVTKLKHNKTKNTAVSKYKQPAATPVNALNQLDIQSLTEGDLSSIIDLAPEVLEAANLKGPAKALKTALPALKQLDMQGIASGDISSILDTAPDLMAAANLKGPAKALKTALPALKQLDMQGIASGDISSILDAAPGLMEAANLKGPAKALKTALPALKQLDMQGIASGDISSILDAAPGLMEAANFKGPAKALKTALPALKQLDMQGIASGDISSILDAAPGLMEAADFKGPAKALKTALPALKQLDIKGIMDGDLQSLLKAAPDLLNSFGFGDAASVLKKHGAAIGKLDFKGILNGDLSSVGDAATEFLSSLGGDEEQAPKKKQRKKRTRNRKGKRGGAQRKHTQYRSNNKPWAKEGRDVTQAKPKAKAKSAKPALKVLDGGLNEQPKKQTANKPTKSSPKQSVKQVSKLKLGKGMAANDPIFGKMNKPKFKAGGLFKGLARSPIAKTLGRFTGPLRSIMGAADMASTLADDSLSKREKSQQIGTAAGGIGGAMAGAAAGAAIGSIIPGVGTLIGGAIGGAIGSFGGESLGGFLGDWFGSKLEDDKPTSSQASNTADNTSTSTQSQPALLANAQPLSIGKVDQTLGRPAANDALVKSVASNTQKTSETSNNLRSSQLQNTSSQSASVQSTANNSQQTQPTNASSIFGNILSLAGNVLGPVGAITGTIMATQPKANKPGSVVSKMANATGILGHVVNGLSILNTANNDALSAKEKAQSIGETGGSWLTGELISRSLGKSKNPRVAAVAPLLSFFGSTVAGKMTGGVSGWFSEKVLGKEQANAKADTQLATASQGAALLSPKLENDPNALHEITKKDQTSSSSQPNVNSSVAVNANITVNATPEMSAVDIAEQIKQVLEQKQQQAQRDMRLRYIDEVA
ncbi:hypothetical protein HG263_02820 [Pseudoalteromonas sp. JBTF-M23]|uniref:Uncharacterized protein n=1 Tax=Pseudoalteromonas caenipelagi TaxID=2726988 RepID=A0A849V9M7_9GAMM|nr:hypothetical protein [Pseudoalteromonas caenipelagi]NOU49480.1 hypothetical protein [Pseudoalteromonas caenipelagi]